MDLQRTIAPATEAVSLKETKDFLKVTNTDEDALIVSLIYAATELVEKYLNRALITQTYQYNLDSYPNKDRIKLLYGPIQSISSITSTLSDESTSVFDSGSYYIANSNLSPYISLTYTSTWPSYVLQPSAGVEIIYVSGYGDTADDVPSGIQAGIKSLVANMFENREDEIVVLPALIKTMLYQYKSYQWL